MSLIVMKFGGTSVANIDAINNVADKVTAEVKRGNSVAVVVSAMAGVTNQLVGWCNEVNSAFDCKEYDTVVSSGEQVTSGLLALAIQNRGVPARSWMGWQIRVETDDVHSKARIKTINVETMRADMEKGVVAVVPGFQGVSQEDRITTLGRGGSDTSAVAVAAALKADRCDIYTDVDGVYTTDPRIVPQARKISKISYEEMLEMASVGAKVLQTRSVEMAMKSGIPVQVLSSFDSALGSDLPGTLLKKEDATMEKEVVTGVTYVRDEAKVTVYDLPDVPGVAAQVFGPLADAAINVDMIVQNVSTDEEVKKTDMTFTVPRTDLDKTLSVLEKELTELEGVTVGASAGEAKISVIGIGMRSHTGVALTMFKTLAEKGINIHVITTSEIKISVLISEEYLELAVRSLHTAYGLDSEEAAVKQAS